MNPKLERLGNLITENGLKRLALAKVAIIGLGGVGGEACIALARSGVGTLVIQDYDRVEESNFNRQIIANLTNLNRLKVDAMEELILSINPKCHVIKLSEKYNVNSSLFTNEFDYLIDAIDSIEDKYLLIKNCLEHNITFISSMGTARKMDLKKLAIMDISHTTYDPIARIIRKKLREEEKKVKFPVLCSTEEPFGGAILGSYLPVTATAGLMLADYIIKKIIA